MKLAPDVTYIPILLKINQNTEESSLPYWENFKQECLSALCRALLWMTLTVLVTDYMLFNYMTLL